MDFGIKLKKLRTERNLTQLQMAEILETSKSNISKYEAGSVEPSLDTIEKLTNYFCVSSDYLLGLSNEKLENKQPDKESFFFFFFFDDKDLQEAFVSALKNALKTQNMTVSELCEKTEINIDTCNQYLAGEHEPSLEHLVRLSKALDVSVDQLLGQGSSTSPVEKKLLNAFSKLTEDNQDIIIGKTKELLREQRFDNPPVAAGGERKASGK